jgi:germination protein M
MRGRLGFLAAGVAAASLLAGCGKTATPTTTTATTGTQTALKVYFYRGNALVPVAVHVPATQAVASAAISMLLSGPSAGFATALPSGGRVESIAVSRGVATVRLSPNLDALPRTAQAQIVYTLTQFPTITSVDGKPFSSPATRDTFSDLTTNGAIFVATPLRDSTVSGPVHVTGTADVFEGTLAVDIWSGGKLLRTQIIQATSGTGTRGTWSATIKLPTGPARLDFYEPSAENGSHLHGTELDLTVR